MISQGLHKMIAPALAAGMLMGFAGISQAQTFTFTTTNNSTGTNQSTGSGPNTITGTGTGAANLFFTNTPDGTNTLLTVPTNIVPFRIVPVFNAPATNPALNTVLTTNYNVTFNDTVTITSGGSTGSVTFANLNFTGALTATFLGVGAPNTVAGYAFNDNVNFTIPAADLVPQNVLVGGTVFQVSLTGFTNPGNPNGQTPEGTIGGRITAVPEPGSVAMMIGMGATGAGFLVRRRRRK